MAKFNTLKEKEIHTNYMGGRAFKQSPEEELAFAVFTTFLEDAFYESKDVRISRVQELIKKCTPEYVAKLSIYVRSKMHMRSVYALLIGELSKLEKGNGKGFTRIAIAKGVERPDDITEILSYLGVKKIPSRVKRGINDALNNFSSYQLAKYQGKNREISLVDVFNLCHPKPKTVINSNTFKLLMRGELKNTETWEARLSAGESKEEAFGDLLRQNKLGYMALLRNLRNIAETGNMELARLAIEQLTSPDKVAKSKQLPFRFLSAYKALAEMSPKSSALFEKDKATIPLLQEAVEKAFTLSIKNIPVLSGRTAILSDNSGSMQGGLSGSLVSAYSKTSTADIANLFATLYWLRADNTFVGLFGDRLITPKMDRDKSVLQNFGIINSSANSCGAATETGIFEFFHTIIREKTKVDRIVIFSDCQVGTGCQWYDMGTQRGDDFNKLFNAYKKLFPSTITYCVDLKGYGKPMTPPQDGILNLAGWSDQIFSIMEKYEMSAQDIVDEIMEIKL